MYHAYSPNPPKPTWFRVLGGAYYGLICLLFLAAGSVFGYIGQSEVLGELVRQSITGTKPEEVFQNKESLIMLVLGCDEDRSFINQKVTKAKARSDMMLVAKLDFKSKKISGVSIPRDMLASTDGYRMQKINAFHAIGGPELSQRVVEDMLDIKIDRTVVLDYKAFQEMVDLVGGIEIFVAKKMKWTDRAGGLFIDLKPGRQHLDGYNAMGFVRFRHSDSDFERQKRQKDFMLAFKDAVMKHKTLIGQVANKAVEVMGGGLNAKESAALALFSQSVRSENIKMGMIPVLPASGYDLRLDRDKLPQTLREFGLVPKLSNVSQTP